MTLDSAVRIAYRENPEAAHLLLREIDTWKKDSMRWLHLPHMPWADFIARVRDLCRG